MKRVFRPIALIALLALMGASASAVTISSNTAADTATPPLLLQPHESAAWSVIGTATGTIRLERSDNARNWKVVGTSVTAGSINWSGTVRTEDRAEYFRFRVSTITVGSYPTIISDQSDLVQEVKNRKHVPIFRIYDESIQVLGNIESDGVLPSTATTSGNSTGQSIPAYLAGSVDALEGSLLVATTPASGYGFAVIVGPATNDLTNWVGIAKTAASTGSLIDVYYSGFVLALTTGTVNPGDTLVTTTSAAGYLTGDSTPTTGADVGIALSGGTAAGGRTKIKLR